MYFNQKYNKIIFRKIKKSLHHERTMSSKNYFALYLEQKKN